MKPGITRWKRTPSRDHAVEENAVVKALVRERRDALDMVRRQVRAKPDDDVSAGG